MLVIGALLVIVLRIWGTGRVFLAASVITLLIAGQFTASPTPGCGSSRRRCSPRHDHAARTADVAAHPDHDTDLRALVGVLLHSQLTFESSAYEFFDPGDRPGVRLPVRVRGPAVVWDGAADSVVGHHRTVGDGTYGWPLNLRAMPRCSFRAVGHSQRPELVDAGVAQFATRVLVLVGVGADSAEFSFTTGPHPSPFKARLISDQKLIDNQGGDFVVKPADFATDRIVLIASGIGITRYISMLRTWFAAGTDLSPVVLVHAGGRRQPGAIDVLAAAAVPGSSGPEIIENGRLSQAIDRVVDLSHELAAAGPPPALLHISGVPRFRLRHPLAPDPSPPRPPAAPWRIHTDSSPATDPLCRSSAIPHCRTVQPTAARTGRSRVARRMGWFLKRRHTFPGRDTP